jgi:hypothetical protein
VTAEIKAKEFKMKRHVAAALATVVVVFLLAATGADAQQRWMAGLKAGGNAADLRGSQAGIFLSYPPYLSVQAPLSEKAVRFTGGGFIRMYVNDVFSLQAEALYTQNGGKGAMTGTVLYKASNNEEYLGDISGEMNVSMDYVQVPVLGIFSFPGGESWVLTAFGGISTGFLVDANAKVEGEITFPQGNLSSTKVGYSQTLDISSMISSVDVGGLLGVGLEIGVGNVQLLFDARLTFGFISVLEEGDEGVYNQAIAVSGGVGIPFGSDI